MFTMMVGWRERGGGERKTRGESDVRIGREVQGDVGDCSGLAPVSQGQRKSFKKPFLDKW